VEVKISELPQGQRVERWLEVLPPGVEEKRKQKKKVSLIAKWQSISLLYKSFAFSPAILLKYRNSPGCRAFS